MRLAGEVMHVDMDEVEASWIVKCAGQKERQRRPIQWSEIAEYNSVVVTSPFIMRVGN
jgi:hypothetical protein